MRNDARPIPLLHWSNSRALRVARPIEPIKSVVLFAGGLGLGTQGANGLCVQPLDPHDPAPVATGNDRIAIGVHQAVLRRKTDHSRRGLEAETRTHELQAISLDRTGP